MVLALWLAQRFTRPLKQLTLAAQQIAKGNYNHNVREAGGDEVALLARTFNMMSGRLASQFDQIEQDRQQLRAVLGGMIEGVIAIDGESRILFANERAAEFLEFSADSAAGRRLWEVVRQRPVQEIASAA